MIEEYFRKEQESLLDDKLKLEKDYTRIVNQIKETEKFIQLLEEKSDPNFESFTPREVNVKNRTEIKNLQDTKKTLLEEKNSIIRRIDECRCKIEEFQTFLHCVKEQKMELEKKKEIKKKQLISNLDILQYVSRERNNSIKVLNNSIIDPIMDINRKIERILQYIDLDRERAKIELQQICIGMEEIKSNFEVFACVGSIENDANMQQCIEKFIEKYRQNHEYDVKIFFDAESITISNNKSEYKEIRNILVFILEDIIVKDCILHISINSIDNICRFRITVKEIDNEESEKLQNILSNDIRIRMYTYLLSIVINYDSKDGNIFEISFSY
jgi:hypothetical protein